MHISFRRAKQFIGSKVHIPEYINSAREEKHITELLDMIIVQPNINMLAQLEAWKKSISLSYSIWSYVIPLSMHVKH
jgi:hypothetical protein